MHRRGLAGARRQRRAPRGEGGGRLGRDLHGGLLGPSRIRSDHAAPWPPCGTTGDVINHRAMVEAVHRWDALAGVELFYAGGLGDNLGTRYAATAMHQFQSPWMPHSYTYDAEVADLRRVVRMHGEAAQRAVDAGFDIVYLHGTHGTLPVQALSRHFNRRTDGYGGSFENRARLWLEILEAMRRAVNGAAAIANRFSIDQLSGPAGRRGGRRGPRLRRAGHPPRPGRSLGRERQQPAGMGRGCRPVALLQDQSPGAVDARGEEDRQGAGGECRPLHRSRRDGARPPLRPVRHHRLRPALDRRSLPAAQDRRRPDRRHPRMHRLQPVHLPLRAQRRHRLHPESDGAGGIPARLASGAGRADLERRAASPSSAPGPPDSNAH